METTKPENNSNIHEVKGICTYFYSNQGISKAVKKDSFKFKKQKILRIFE